MKQFRKIIFNLYSHKNIRIFSRKNSQKRLPLQEVSRILFLDAPLVSSSPHLRFQERSPSFLESLFKKNGGKK